MTATLGAIFHHRVRRIAGTTAVRYLRHVHLPRQLIAVMAIAPHHHDARSQRRRRRAPVRRRPAGPRHRQVMLGDIGIRFGAVIAAGLAVLDDDDVPAMNACGRHRRRGGRGWSLDGGERRRGDHGNGRQRRGERRAHLLRGATRSGQPQATRDEQGHGRAPGGEAAARGARNGQHAKSPFRSAMVWR